MNAMQRPASLRFLSAIVLLSTAVPVSAEVLWRGDFETGNTEQWRGAPKTDSVQVVTDPVREGKYALRIDGTNAARRGTRDRIELQHQPAPPGTAEGTERYFGWSVFVPKKLTDDSHALGYFETRNSLRTLSTVPTSTGLIGSAVSDGDTIRHTSEGGAIWSVSP